VAVAVHDLAARTGVLPESIAVVTLDAVEWSDSSLGCPRPGYVYLQVITPGYRIVLAAGGQTYVYHTDTRSAVVLCQTSNASADPESSEPTSLAADNMRETASDASEPT
jgi:hypothetical protein